MDLCANSPYSPLEPPASNTAFQTNNIPYEKETNLFLHQFMGEAYASCVAGWGAGGREEHLLAHHFLALLHGKPACSQAIFGQYIEGTPTKVAI